MSPINYIPFKYRCLSTMFPPTTLPCRLTLASVTYRLWPIEPPSLFNYDPFDYRCLSIIVPSTFFACRLPPSLTDSNTSDHNHLPTTVSLISFSHCLSLSPVDYDPSDLYHPTKYDPSNNCRPLTTVPLTNIARQL